MVRLLKWIGITVGALIVLVIALLLIVPLVVDVNKYKSQIESMVTQRTGRAFSIGGDMDLTIFPWIGFALSDVHLGNPQGFTGKDFVSVDHFEVRVKLIPMIFRYLQVRRFILKGPRIVLEKEGDGRGNWEHLLKSREQTEVEKRQTPGRKLPFTIRNLMADEFAITSGELVWIDHQKGTEKRFTGINLVLDGISLDKPISVELSAHLDGRPLKVQGKVGPIGRTPGKGKVPIFLNLRAFGGIAANLEGFFADLDRQPQFNMAIEVQPFSPRRLAKAMGLDLSKKTRDPDALKEMSLKATIAGRTGAVTLRDGLLKLDDSTLTFSLDAKQFEKPIFSFNFGLDSIDLDRYLPPPNEVKEKGKTGTRPEQRRRRKPDYTALRKLMMDGTVRIGRLKVRGANVSDVNLTINARNGIIRVSPFSVNVYEGVLLGNVTVNLQRDTPTIETSWRPKEVLSRLITASREIGISSLEFEIHGTTFQVAGMLPHLAPFLPPAILDWKPTGEMVFDLSVAATTGHESGTTKLNLEIRLKNGAFSSPNAIKSGDGIEGDIHVSVIVPAQEDQPVGFQGEFGLESGEILLGSFNFDFKEDPFRLRFLGEYDPEEHRFSSLSINFHAPTLGGGTITAVLENPADPRGEVKVAIGPIANERAFNLFVKDHLGHASPILKTLSINGTTLISALIRGSPARYSIQGLVEMSAVDLAIPAHEIKAEGVELRFPFAIEFPDHERSVSRIDLDAAIDSFLRAERIQWRSGEWPDVAVRVAFVQNTLLLGQTKIPIWGGSVTLDRATIKDPLQKTREIMLGLRLDRLNLSEMTKAFSPAFVQFVPRGTLEGKFSEIKVSKGGLVTRGTMTVRALGGRIEARNVRGSTPFSCLPEVSMEVFIKDILLEEASLRPFLPAAILNWKLSGAMAFDLGLGTKGVRELKNRTVDLGIQLKDGAFSSPDETKLGEGIQGEAHVRLNIPTHQERPASFQGDLNLEAGEILFGSLYLNLQQDPLRLRTLGAYDAQNRRLPSLAVQFHTPGLGEGTMKATVENLDDPQGEVNLSLGPISNERAFELFVKEPFGHVSPVLNDISVNGETRITASIRGSPSLYWIQGLLETSVEDLAIPARGMWAKGVKIQFPVSLRYPKADTTVSSAGSIVSMKGFIEAKWIQWESQGWGDLNVPLTLKENTLFVPPSIKLHLWGGTAIIEGAKIEDPFGETMEITLGLKLNGLDLSELTKATAPFAVPGSLESDFSEIRVSAKGLATSGNLTIHALGGRIEVSNIRGDTPFSRLREVSMEVLLRDVDLKEVSRLFDFGEMGGVIEGWVRGLTFSFGQPEGFELEIRSVKKRGVKQYVNAEAVNDLSILSSGSPFSIRKGVLRMINYFPYAKLGIYCKLENDVFTLRGTIHENGVEYLIKKGPFRGIDVINRNPENRIRWKQMVSRLKAVGQGAGVAKGSNQE